MKIDKFVKMMLVVIAVLLALNCATVLRGPADAQSSGAKFGYIHFLFSNPGITVVSDLRNGNVWRFPTNNWGLQGKPVYIGTFDFSALDEPVQK
jgi:hypothetical protein